MLSKYKEDAYKFFAELRDFLNTILPGPKILRSEIEQAVQSAKTLHYEKPSSFPEGAFLNKFVIGNLHRFLMHNRQYSAEEAKRALLSESYRNQSQWASGSPVRSGSHPFSKVANASATEIMESWRSNKLVHRSCPDLALRLPSPYRTVFEAKYYCSSSPVAAERTLVTSIYQAFFYLALPRLPETATHAAWDYEYACVLAYDASDRGTLAETWEGLPNPVKLACWNGANLFVMILRSADP
jgi:hypothetical protein